MTTGMRLADTQIVTKKVKANGSYAIFTANNNGSYNGTTRYLMSTALDSAARHGRRKAADVTSAGMIVHHDWLVPTMQ